MRAGLTALSVALFFVSHAGAAGSPLLPYERTVSAPLFGPGSAVQGRSAAASDGETFFIVWVSYTRNLMLTRLTADGIAIEPFGKLLASSVGYDRPAIIWNGQSFLVIWREENGDTKTSRMSRTGELADPTGHRISSGSAPAVAWNGSHYLVTSLSELKITATLLDPQGREITSVQFGSDALYPRSASDGSKFLVVYSNDFYSSSGSTVAALIDGTGSILRDGIVIQERTGRTQPDVVFDREQFLVTYPSRNGLTRAFLSRQGDLIGSPAVVTTRQFGELNRTSVVRDPGGFLVAFEDFYWVSAIPESGPKSLLWTQRLTPTGDPAGDPILVAERAYYNGTPSLVWNSARHLLSWNQQLFDFGPIAVRGSILTPRGEAMQRHGAFEGIPLSLGAHDQGRAKLIWTGSVYVAVWPEFFRELGMWKIMAGRLSRDGEQLDGAGIEVADGLSFDAAFDGQRILVVAQGDVSISPAQLTATFVSVNQVLARDEELVLEEQSFGRPQVSFNGTVYLVKLFRRALRITLGGVVLEPGGFSTPESDYAYESVVASDGRDFLVVFSSLRPANLACPPHCTGIFAYRITTDGQIGLVRQVTDRYPYGGYAVASNGAGYLLVHAIELSRSTSTFNYDVFGVRLGSDGTPLDSFPGLSIATSQTAEMRPSVTSADRDYFVVWYKPNNSFNSIGIASGAVIQPNGVVSPLRIPLTPPVPGSVVVSGGPDRQVALSYARELPAEWPFFGASRSLIRMLDAGRPSRRRTIVR